MHARLLSVLLTTFALGSFPLPMAAQSYCQASYGSGTCPSCNAPGRTYVKVGGVYCTACTQFCNVSYRTPSEPSSEVSYYQLTSEPTFLLQVSDSLLYSLAQVHPEGAMLLAVLQFRSRTADALPPERGDGGSDRSMSAHSVMAFIDGSLADDTALAKTKPLPKAAVQSRTYWNLEKFGQSAELRISHRFLGERDRVVQQPYKDLAVSLQWVSTTGAAGYWQALSWKELP
jgi:hypothetical protein